jgi:hypothetical protein
MKLKLILLQYGDVVCSYCFGYIIFFLPCRVMLSHTCFLLAYVNMMNHTVHHIFQVTNLNLKNIEPDFTLLCYYVTFLFGVFVFFCFLLFLCAVCNTNVSSM